MTAAQSKASAKKADEDTPTGTSTNADGSVNTPATPDADAETVSRTGGSGDVYVANTSFSADVDGAPVAVHGGITRVRAGHPIMAGRENLFDPIDVHLEHSDRSGRSGETRG